MIVSDITVNHLVEYLNIYETTNEDLRLLEQLLSIAKDYIKTYTGQTNLDKYESFVIAVYVLVQGMYDNRALYVDDSNLNKVVTSILDMHSINLL